MKFTEGGVCAAKGFSASGMHCGIRRGKTKEDLSLICSKVPCQGAGLFTRNQVKAAPVLLDMETIKHDSFHAIIANSGIANACTGEEGYRYCLETAAGLVRGVSDISLEVERGDAGILDLCFYLFSRHCGDSLPYLRAIGQPRTSCLASRVDI